jgi:MFS family permease
MIQKPPIRELPLLVAIFLDLVGFSMIIPDVQTRLERFGANGGSIGLVLSAYFLVQIVVSPFWGRYSDRVGRKPVLVICGGLSALSLLVYAFAHSVEWILLSRIIAGFAAANTAAAQAYLVDGVEEELSRTAAMGRVGAAITAGLLLGPALGGWLSGIGGNFLLGWSAAIASGIGALWIAFALPSVAPLMPDVKATHSAGFSLLRDVPQLRPLFLLATVAFFALACLEGTFGRLIHVRLSLGPPEFGLIFGFESLVSVLVQSVGLRWLSLRFRPRWLLCLGFLLQGIGLTVTPYAPNLTALFGCSTPYAIGGSITTPTINSLCSVATPQERQGEMFGLLQGARSAGFLLGPTIGGMLFDWRSEAPYLLAGSVLLLAAIGIAVVKSPSQSPPLNE